MSRRRWTEAQGNMLTARCTYPRTPMLGNLRNRLYRRSYDPRTGVRVPPSLWSSVLWCDLLLVDAESKNLSKLAALDNRSERALNHYPLPQISTRNRMLVWNNKDFLKTLVPGESRRSTRHLRAFCFLPTLNERPALFRTSRLKPCIIDRQPSNTRAYTWETKDKRLFRKSSTAYYDILKVSPSATQSQIKTAYYKQSFLCHPDRNAGCEEAKQRFVEITEAYNVLGNIGLRKKYDRNMLSPSDVNGAGRPSSRDPTRATGSHQQKNSLRYSTVDGRKVFDFDAFYQAHYGEQLQREKDLRQQKAMWEDKQKKTLKKDKVEKVFELTVIFLMALGGFILVGMRS